MSTSKYWNKSRNHAVLSIDKRATNSPHGAPTHARISLPDVDAQTQSLKGSVGISFGGFFEREIAAGPENRWSIASQSLT